MFDVCTATNTILIETCFNGANNVTDTSEETEAQYQLISRNFIPIYFN
ncbi:unnamed protein product, partial [marine sediment metagenome]